MVNEYKLLIGSYGWQYKSWQESFYPEDLPEDWQFGYYTNEYNVIMIPWHLTQDNFELIEQSLEDSEETCRLLFELPITGIHAKTTDEIQLFGLKFLNKITAIGSRCLGIVISFNYSEIVDLSAEQLDCVMELLTSYQSKMNVSVDVLDIAANSDVLPEQFNTILTNLKIELCRHNDSRLFELTAATFHITYCGQSGSSPKEMRAIVENSLYGECESSTNVLIFRLDSSGTDPEDDPSIDAAIEPSHEQMNTAAVISDLL